MYLNSYFIYDIAEVKKPFTLDLPQECHMCFKITDENISLLPFFYKHLLRSSIKSGFIFYMDIKDKITKASTHLILDYVIPSIFHYQYKYNSFSLPVIFAHASCISNDSFTSLLNSSVREQGFSGIYTVSVSDSHLITASYSSDKESIVAQYENILLNVAHLKEPVLFQIRSLNEISSLISTIYEAQKTFTFKHSQLARLLTDYNKLEDDRKQLSFQNGVLTQSLESLSKYSSDINEPVSFYKKKIADVVHFYKNEYDILPLWYKRLGHIIKVIAGKRTFRSLYDDNSKKYKL